MLSVYLLQMLSFIHLHGEYFRSSAHSTRVCVSRCLNIYSSATIGPHRFHASPLPDNSRWGDIRIWHVSPCASVWIWHLRLFILHVFEMKLDVLAWWWLVWHDAESWRKVFFCMFLTAGLSWAERKSCLKSCHTHSGLSFLLPQRGNFWALKTNLHVLKVLYSSPPPSWRHVWLFPGYLTATSEPLLHFIRNVFKGGHGKTENPSKACKSSPKNTINSSIRPRPFYKREFRNNLESRKEMK